VSKDPPAVRRAHLGEPPERDADADIDFAEIAARPVLAIGEDAPYAEPQAEQTQQSNFLLSIPTTRSSMQKEKIGPKFRTTVCNRFTQTGHRD
jgi:hypothetical protein